MHCQEAGIMNLGVQTPSEVLVCTWHTHLRQVRHTGPDIRTVVEVFKCLVMCSTNCSNASTTIRALSVYSVVTCICMYMLLCGSFNDTSHAWPIVHECLVEWFIGVFEQFVGHLNG